MSDNRTTRYKGKIKSSELNKTSSAGAKSAARAVLYVPEGVSPTDDELDITVVAVKREAFEFEIGRRDKTDMSF